MTSGHSRDLPNPPVYLRSALHIPPFFSSNHPYTKWMLNMIRGNANHRLNTMVKERPELFQQYYQVADQPDNVSNIYYDSLPIFHAKCVLYLTPLGLAIYLKREKALEMLLKSGVNNPYQSCYATEVFTKGSRRADILEIFPACIALRREFFEAIHLMCNGGKMEEDLQSERVTLQIHEPMTLRYENRDRHRLFRYRDLLHYATEAMQRRPNFPLSRLLDTLLGEGQDFYSIDEQQFNGSVSQPVSIFRRLARIAYYQDSDLRMSLQLISSLDSLIKNRCCVWKTQSPPENMGFAEFIDSRLGMRSKIDMDQDGSLGLLCGLYQRIRERTRNGPLDHMGQLFFHMLTFTRWHVLFINVDQERLQLLFEGVNENISVSVNTLITIQKHVQAIVALERDREMVVTHDARLRREKGRTTRSKCRLFEGKTPIQQLQSSFTTPTRNKIVYVNSKVNDLASNPPGGIGAHKELSGSLFSYRPNSSTCEDITANSIEQSVTPITCAPKPSQPRKEPSPVPHLQLAPETVEPDAQEEPTEGDYDEGNDKNDEERGKEDEMIDDDDLAALESDWQELEQNGGGDTLYGVEASLIDFIQSETGNSSSVVSRSPTKADHKSSDQATTAEGDGWKRNNQKLCRDKTKLHQRQRSFKDSFSLPKETCDLSKNASNNFQTEEQLRQVELESDTVYEESVNRFDMDAYEDKVLHEMIEDFRCAKAKTCSPASATSITTATTSSTPVRTSRVSIYGLRKYNHNQRSKSEDNFPLASRE